MFNVSETVTPPLSFGGAIPALQPQAAPQPQYQPQPQQAPQPQYQPQPQAPMQSAPDAYTARQRPSGGGVRLKKGQKTNLALPGGGALQKLEVGLGWDVNMNSPVPYDLDASVFLLGDNGRVIGDDWFVFYGQTQSPDQAVRHSGDSTDGGGAGDDEIIYIDLTRLNPAVKKMTFIVTINEARERGHNFGSVRNAYVRVSDGITRSELMRFDLTESYANVTSMVIGEVYNHAGTWKFNPVGDGTSDDLMGLCARYGVRVAD